MVTKKAKENANKAGYKKDIVVDGQTFVVPEEAMAIILPKPDIRMMKIKILGVTPLLCHAWSDKAIKVIVDKGGKKATTGREKRNPKAEYEASYKRLANGEPCIPCSAFKLASVTACTSMGKAITKISARQAFFVLGQPGPEMVRIYGKPTMRQDMVRVPPRTGNADIRYRAEFKKWWCEILVRYNALVLSAEQIVNLISNAGFAVGIGDWRPEKDGNFGMFEVATK